MGERKSAFRDTVLVLGALLLATWVAPRFPEWTSRSQVALGTLGLGYVLWSARRDGVRLRWVGLRFDNLAVSTSIYGLSSAALLSPILVRAPLPSSLLSEVPSYYVLAFFQQFLVTACFWRHFRTLLRLPLEDVAGAGGEGFAAALGASVFALAHAPNWGLMALVFLGESFWLFLFGRFRNLFALSLAHAGAALVVSHLLVPSWWLPSMNVGLGFWRGVP